MNTKKFLMLLAAVLLSCASAMAQSGNNESLKGDVNGDGTVDVADLTAIIKIMKDAGGAVGEKMYYWYAGTKQVEASNFTDIASRIPESEIPETGSVSATGQYVYFVLPKIKCLASLVGANGASIKYDYTDAFGYRIYKTLNTINETVYYAVEQITYYWYVGKSVPTSIGGSGWTSLGTNLSGVSYIQVDTSNDPDYTFPKFYVVLPTSLNFKPYNADGSKDESAGWTSSTWSVNNAYTLWSLKDITSDINSRFKK